MKIAVAGGTGLLGALVVAELARQGDEPVVLARSHGIDLTSGAGLPAALAGVDAVVDVANVTTNSRRRAVTFFTAATTQLLAAAARAGARHVVTVSIVGTDTVDLGYYLGKRRQEELLAAGPVPWTLLRATQFHEFARQLVDRSPAPFVVVPRMATRPVAAQEVAAHLVRLAHGAPEGIAQPIAGPEEHELTDLVRRLLRTTGERRLVVPVQLPGRVGTALAGGVLIPAEPYVRGTQTYTDHLTTVTRGG